MTVGPERVWYAGYGSNLSRDRFLRYLEGGRPAGAVRDYPGARDPARPAAERAITVPGGIFFGLESAVWGGGLAFYDAGARGHARMRAYLISREQFSDVVAQEMHREVGVDLDLTPVLRHARHEVGLGRYETLHLVGEHDGAPVLTFSAADPTAIPLNPPAPAYVRMMVSGLREAHGMSDAELVEYLLARPGMAGAWDERRLVALLAEPAAVTPR